MVGNIKNPVDEAVKQHNDLSRRLENALKQVSNHALEVRTGLDGRLTTYKESVQRLRTDLSDLVHLLSQLPMHVTSVTGSMSELALHLTQFLPQLVSSKGTFREVMTRLAQVLEQLKAAVHEAAKLESAVQEGWRRYEQRANAFDQRALEMFPAQSATM